MATSFPSSLDSFTNPSASDALDSVSVPHAAQHANINDAMEAVQAKLGVDGSAVTSSLDYQVNALPAGVVDFATTTTDVNVNTSEQDVLSVSYTPTGTRRIVVVFYCAQVDNPSTTMNFVGRLRTAPSGGGSLVQLLITGLSSSSLSQPVTLMAYTTISAATSYYFTGATSTGTARMNTDSGKPMQMYIMDLGSA